MQTATQPTRLPEIGRKAGYSFAVLINLAILIVVQNLLDWGWPPFLTPEFAEVLPWISLSLAASIVANLIYVVQDRPPLRYAFEVVVNLVSIYATYKMFVVFPFDFTGYDFDWAMVGRLLLVLAMIGAAIGAIVNLAKLANRPDQM